MFYVLTVIGEHVHVFSVGLHSAPQGIMTMLQINCEILDTRIIHMNLNT